MLNMRIKEMPVDLLQPYKLNNKIHDDVQINRIANSIKEFGFTQPVVIDKNNVIIIGHWRVEWAKKLGMEKVPVVIMEELTENQVKKLRILDNKLNESPWDVENLRLDVEELGDFNFWDLEFTVDEFIGDLINEEEPKSGKEWATGVSLAERFIIPPFSIRDAKQGYRNERKKAWRVLINDNGESRENVLAYNKKLYDMVGGEFTNTSLLDPVLAECVNRFFCIEGGATFDPFAGDTVFGFVSGKLGHKFTGIELRKEQAELNAKRCNEAGLDCTYYNDSSENMDKYIPNNSQDMLFSCPPYRNLEKYSDDPRDLSNKGKDEFFNTIKAILTNTYNKLKDNSFAVIVIGEVRDGDGEYINFVGETIKIMIDAGYKYYNEIILATPIGTNAIRAGRFFNGTRKVGKVHQNVLVFYKWDIKAIKNKFKALDFSDLDFNEFITHESANI